MNCCCNCHRCHAYELKFQQDGKIKHTAILKEPKANCLLYCRLADVKEKGNVGKVRMNVLSLFDGMAKERAYTNGQTKWA